MRDDKAEECKRHVFLVENDRGVSRAMTTTLECAGYRVTAFHQALDCLAKLQQEPTLCSGLITAVKLPDMDGITLLAKVKRLLPSLPVIVMTAYADVAMAVRAFKLGASDLIEKPFGADSLLAAVKEAFENDDRPYTSPRQLLTETERQVLQLVLQGKNNKEIARSRHCSIRTIEDERSHIMRKPGARNLIDLVRAVAVVRIPDLRERS